MNLKKRGQVSIFVIIAFAVIAFALLFFIFRSSGAKSDYSDASKVKDFIQKCIIKSSLEVIYAVGLKGGYYFPPEPVTSSGVAYYYSGGKSFVPSKEEIEKELSYYISKKIFFCTKNFADFPDYEISQGEIKVKTKIENNQVVVDASYPVSIKKEDFAVQYEKFNNIEIPVRLGVLHDSAEKFINQQINNEGICLNCLLEVSVKNDFYVNILDYDENTVIFIFRDKKSTIENNEFRLAFAVKYVPEKINAINEKGEGM